jgi:hypothetical protein
MKDPMPGTFRVTGNYDAHPNSHLQKLTGVLMVPGMPPTPAEVDADTGGKWVGQTELPVTVDRADPANIRVEWQDVRQFDQQAAARQQAAAEAARLAGGPAPGFPDIPGGTTTSGPGWSTTTTFSGGDVGGQVNQALGEALRRVGMDPNRVHISGSPNVEVTVSTDGTVPPGFGNLFDTVFGNPGGGNPGGGNAGPASGVFGTLGEQLASQLGGQAGGLFPTEEATGVVVAAHDVAPGVEPRGPGSSLVELTLDVTRADGSRYSTTTRMGFSTPARRAAVTTIGTRLPIKVSPANPNLVTIDVAKLNLP